MSIVGRHKGSKKGKDFSEKGEFKHLLNCIYCKKDFKRHYFRKFCSWKCYILWRIGKNSPNFGKPMSIEQKRKISETKIGTIPWNKELRGEKSHMWIDGRTTKEKRLRGWIEYKLWRDENFKRDNYTCQNCGAKSGKNYDGTIHLEVHHGIPIRKLINTPFEKYIYDIKNGITLCCNCHNAIPKKELNYVH